MWMIDQNRRLEPLFEKTINGNPAHSCQYASLPKIYVQNASIDFCRSSNLKRYNSISGDKIVGLPTEGNEGLDINYPEDLFYAQTIAEQELL